MSTDLTKKTRLIITMRNFMKRTRTNREYQILPGEGLEYIVDVAVHDDGDWDSNDYPLLIFYYDESGDYPTVMVSFGEEAFPLRVYEGRYAKTVGFGFLKAAELFKKYYPNI